MFQLVVATRNRNKELSRLLLSLAKSGNASFIGKLIVVDQSDSDIFRHNETLISEFIGGNSNINVVHILDKRRGLSKARNLGLQHVVAHGYLCFPDDDCWYPENFFYDMANQLEQKKAALYITYYREEHEERFSHKTDYKVNWFNLKRTPFSSVGIFLDLNAVTLEDIYFDENIGAGTDIPFAEDTLFCYRLFNKGYKLKKISHPYVYHRVFRGEPNYYGSAYSQSYILLHKDLGFKFKVLFVISVVRTAVRSLFNATDRMLLKGKLALLKDKSCKRLV